MDAMSGGTISADREAERTVRTVSETRYGRISGIGYCVTSVARRLTATSAPEGLQDVAECCCVSLFAERAIRATIRTISDRVSIASNSAAISDARDRQFSA